MSNFLFIVLEGSEDFYFQAASFNLTRRVFYEAKGTPLVFLADKGMLVVVA